MLSNRKELNLHATTLEFIEAMSEGNPGGLTILMSILKQEPNIGYVLILGLDDMNIRGSQIWIGYKDYCKEDIMKFIQAIKDRDPEMINKINQESLNGNHNDRAVIGGASFPNGRELL